VTVSFQSIMDDPAPWGCLAIAATVRPGAPDRPFLVKPGRIDPDKRAARAERVHQRELRNTDLIGGDVLLHIDTGMYGCVVSRIDPWDFWFEAWTLPDDEQGLAQLAARGLEGEWACVGSAVREGETIPSWFPFVPIPVMYSHDKEGRFNPEYVDAVMDSHPGVRKGYDPREEDPYRVKFKTPGQFTAREKAIMKAQREGLQRFIEGEGVEGLQEKLKELDEPLEDGETRDVFIGSPESKKDRSISYKGQDKRS